MVDFPSTINHGHKHIIDSAAKNSDELLILVGNNSKKFTMLSTIDYRKELVKNYCNNSKVINLKLTA